MNCLTKQNKDDYWANLRKHLRDLGIPTRKAQLAAYRHRSELKKILGRDADIIYHESVEHRVEFLLTLM